MHCARLAALLAIASLSSPVLGQQDSTKKWSIGSAQIRIGPTQLGLNTLNAGLASNGRPTFAKTVSSFGLGGYMRGGRFIFGTSADAFLPQQRDASDSRVKLSGNSASINAGLVVIDRSSILVYPTVSVGLRTTRLRIEQSAPFDYGDGLRDPWRSVDLSSSTGTVDYGFAAERQTTAWRGHAFAIGVQAGVSQPVGGTSATSGDQMVGGAPRLGSGRYLRVTFGTPLQHRSEALAALSAMAMGFAR